MIGVEVGDKGDLKIAGFHCWNLSCQSSELGAAHDAWSEIHKVSVIVNDNDGSRAGAVRIGNRCAGTQQYDLGSQAVFLRLRLLRLLSASSGDQQQHHN